MLAFELVQCGIAPSVFLPMIEQHWDRLRDIFLRAEKANVRETSDVMLILTGITALATKSPVGINYTTMDRISERLSLLDGEGVPARALVLNLSATMRSFHASLANYHLRPEPPVEAGKKKQRR